MQDYKIELDIFEGPLDLLLYLIKRDELNIYDIPITRITEQYLQYLELMKMLDLNIAGEFILMAATLMYIKSKMLLPPEEREEEVEEEVDPRLELVRQLLEYRRFKDVAQELRSLEESQSQTFSRDGEGVAAPAPERRLAEVSIFDLLAAFSDVLKRAEPERVHEVVAEAVTVADKIRMIETILFEMEVARFGDFFRRAATRLEIVVTFLALLELIRMRRVQAYQREPFGPIEITSRLT